MCRCSQDAQRQVRLLDDIKREMSEAQHSLEQSRRSFAQAEAAAAQAEATAKSAADAASAAQGKLLELQRTAARRAAQEGNHGNGGTRPRGSRAAKADPSLPFVYLLTPTCVCGPS